MRAIGPLLTDFGVTDALADPALELHDANGAPLVDNNDWKESQQADIEATGLQPTNDLESAILTTLAPAGYTAMGRSGGSTGAARWKYTVCLRSPEQRCNIALLPSPETDVDLENRYRMNSKTAKSRAIRRFFVAGFVMALALTSSRGTRDAALEATRVATGLTIPLYGCAPPGDTSRIFVPGTARNDQDRRPGDQHGASNAFP